MKNEMLQSDQITLIDDVVTLGRTSYACAQKLHETCPDMKIKLFALMRTKGLTPDIDVFIEPSVNAITYNKRTGNTTRFG